MKTLTFDEEVNLDKTHFTNLEELRNYLMLQSSTDELSDEVKELLDERLREAKKSNVKGKSWEELRGELMNK